MNKCHVTTGELKSLRSYQRLREDHIRSASMHVNHMQKALTVMNIRIKEVLSQIHGKSGLNMIEAIIYGERNKERLLSLCHKSIKNKKGDLMLKALEGHYTKEGLFMLKQAYEGYYFYQNQINQCDEKVSEVLDDINDNNPEDLEKLRKPIRHNTPKIENLGGHMLKIFGGKDATVLSGITDYTWLNLLSEVGTDLSNWKTEKYFTS